MCLAMEYFRASIFQFKEAYNSDRIFSFLHFTRCQSIPCLKWWHCLVNTFDLTWPDFSINLLFCLQFSIEKVPWFHLILNFVAVTELWVQCTRARRDCHQICTWHLKTFWCWNYKKKYSTSHADYEKDEHWKEEDYLSLRRH